ncbi:protein kinase [Myxococcota bacterium]|nr:protein kinase [Myxococcota bacterium]
MIPGAVLEGRFQVVSRIAEGGHGAVWRGLDLRTEEPVALKFLRNPTPRLVAAFYEEYRALASLKHPLVVSAIAFRPSEFGPVLAMELVDGSPINDAVGAPRTAGRIGQVPDRGAGSWERVRSPLVQLLGALADIHDLGLVHRDIKPGNVFVDKRGTVRLLDFGLAWFDDDFLDASQSFDPMGTIGYSAPEVLGGKSPGPHSDLYSVGVILWELLVGRRPFRAQGIAAMINEQRLGPPRALRILRPDLPAAVDDLIQRLLMPDPHERVGSAAEALRLLREGGLLGGLRLSRLPSRRGVFRASPPLPPVGREDELATLHAAADLAEAGRPAVAVVHGEAGIGKSWLLEQALTSLRRRGFLAAGHPGISPLRGPHGLLEAALRRLVASVGCETGTSAYGELVAALVGTGGASTMGAAPRADDPVPPPPDLQAARLSAYEGVVRLVRDVGRSGPVAVVFDQLHHADGAVVDLLRHLAVSLLEGEGVPVLLLLGTRDAGMARWPELRLARERGVALRMAPLSRRDLVGLFETEPTLAAERRRAAERLHAESGGVPGVAQGVLDRWCRRALVRRTVAGIDLTRRFFADDWDASAVPGARAPSPSVVGLVEDQLQALPEPARRVAPHLAVLRPGADYETIRGVLDAPDWDLIAALDALVEEGLLAEEIERGRPVYRFVHPQLAEQLELRVPGPERAALHRRAAAVIRAGTLGGPGGPVRIAAHLRDGGEHGEAARWYLREAQEARARQARDAAVAALRSAADCAAAAGARSLRARALDQICEEARATARWQVGLDAAEALAGLAREAEDPELEAKAAVWAGTMRISMGELDHAEACLRHAVALAPPGCPVGADGLMRLAQVLVRLSRAGEAVQLLDAAADVFAAAGDAVGEARALNNRGLLAFHMGEHLDARQRLESLLTRPLPPWLRAQVETNLALALREVGDPGESLALLERVVAYHEAAGNLTDYTHSFGTLSWQQARAGLGLPAHFDETLAFARRAGLPATEAMLLLARARAGGADGRPASAERDARRAHRIYEKTGQGVQACVARMELARIALEQNPAQALAHAAQAVERMPAGTSPSLAWQVLGLAARVARRARSEDRADTWAIDARERLVTAMRRVLGPDPERGAVEAELLRTRDLVEARELIDPEGLLAALARR